MCRFTTTSFGDFPACVHGDPICVGYWCDMDIFTHFETILKTSIETLMAEGVIPDSLDLAQISLEPPRERSHGDVSTNAAMVLAKPAGMRPRQLAGLITEKLRAHKSIETVEIAGPGFINLKLKPDVWRSALRTVLKRAGEYGTSTIGAGMAVSVEYVSTNPTGPLHIAHCRGAVLGDALANLLAVSGYKVTREYYVNDTGAQAGSLARSAYLRYREALGEDIGTIPSGLYPGDYLKPVGRKIARDYGDSLLNQPEDEWLPIIRDLAIDEMMGLIRADLARLNIRHDVFFSERSLHAAQGGKDSEIAQAIAALRERGLIYEGVLPPPKGLKPKAWQEREQTLFKSGQFGDDIDRPLIKEDGTYTYFAADIAYFSNKVSRGFKQMIYVLGADHGGYVKRLEAIARALAGNAARLIVRQCQMVRLLRDGVGVRMSKRAGHFVTLHEIVDEIGPDVIRFIMLTRKNDAPLDFDLRKVLEQSRENPVFYVQYAYARICSVFRNAEESLGKQAIEEGALCAADLTQLNDPTELALVKRLAEYPRIVRAAALNHEPHRIAFYLYELASEFHGLWNKGQERHELRFIIAARMERTTARLALLQATQYVLANGLGIIGVNPVEAM